MNAIVAIILAALGGAAIRQAFICRARRKPRLLFVDYRVPSGETLSVNACACNRCKNVVWAQRCDVQPPLFCAYCGVRFHGHEMADDERIRDFIVTD